MAILITNDGDRIVSTIAARNAISTKFDGMEVTVLDAIADPIVGSGEAKYLWSTVRNNWLLCWKTSKDDLTFVNESQIIVEGGVTADHYPQNDIVWGCIVVDENGVVVADITPNVTGPVITIGSQSFNGMTLSFSYAYCTITAAIAAANSVTKASLGLGNVDNTSDINKPISSATQAALNAETAARDTAISSLTKTSVGLTNVDNTADTAKPVSTAQQTALDLKADLDSPHFTGIITGITKLMVGLANVDNTSDANKPVSVAVQSALDLKLDSSLVGIANGLTPLGADLKISTAYLPDSILGQLEYQGTWNANVNNPTIPVAASTNKGHYYVVSTNGATSVDGIADWKVGDWIISNGVYWDKVDNTDAVSSVNGRLGAITLSKTDVNLDNVDNTSDASKPVSTAQQTALDNKADKGLLTASGLTSGTAKLAGRSSAGTGALEEITLSSAFTLSSGQLGIAPSSNYYDIAGGTSSTTVTAANETVAILPVVRPFSLPIGLTNSIFECLTAPSASYIYTLRKKTAAGSISTIGTVTFAASATVGTVSFTSAVSFAIGDKLMIVGAATPDATLMGFYYTIVPSLLNS